MSLPIFQTLLRFSTTRFSTNIFKDYWVRDRITCRNYNFYRVDAVKIPVFEMRMPKDSGSDKEVNQVCLRNNLNFRRSSFNSHVRFDKTFNEEHLIRRI